MEVTGPFEEILGTCVKSLSNAQDETGDSLNSRWSTSKISI